MLCSALSSGDEKDCIRVGIYYFWNSIFKCELRNYKNNPLFVERKRCNSPHVSLLGISLPYHYFVLFYIIGFLGGRGLNAYINNYCKMNWKYLHNASVRLQTLLKKISMSLFCLKIVKF